MPLVTYISVIVLAVAAFLDGYSTDRFLRAKNAKYYETNPIFGPRPSLFRLAVEGSLIIAAEIALTLLVKGDMQQILASVLLLQAGFHMKCFQNNMEIPV